MVDFELVFIIYFSSFCMRLLLFQINIMVFNWCLTLQEMIFFYHIFKQKIILKNKAVKPSGVHDPG